MKPLYREVKASERLPSKGKLPDDFCSDWVLAYWKEQDSWGCTMYDYEDDCWDASEPDIWLEPIEITEEEIKDIFSIVWHTDSGGVMGLNEAITKLLSKLEGE